MRTLADLRRLVFIIRKRFYHRKPPLPTRDGLPHGIDFDLVNTICLNHFDKKAVSAAYQHLSAWKSTGAYRIIIKTNQGGQIKFIYKESVYSLTEIPALNNLPAQPGLPEFLVLSRSEEPLSYYLPKVYQAQELVPGRHYRFFLEDLGENYRRMDNSKDILQAARLFTGFHEALNIWGKSYLGKELIQYGREFSIALQVYTHTNLEQFVLKIPDPTVKRVLALWNRIIDLHLHDDFYTQDCQPIHGDSNFSNIHLHKQNPEKMKIVDWEWAGNGVPLSDLASLLKGSPEETVSSAFAQYIHTSMQKCLSFGNRHRSTVSQQHRLFRWCQLERGLMDAGFLASQSLAAKHTANFNLSKAVTQSLRRVLTAYEQLTR